MRVSAAKYPTFGKLQDGGCHREFYQERDFVPKMFFVIVCVLMTACCGAYRGWKIDVHFFTYPDVDVDKVISLHYKYNMI